MSLSPIPAIDHAIGRYGLKSVAWMKLRLNNSEPYFILLAAFVGLVAGTLTAALGHAAHALQVYLFGISPEHRLSESTSLPIWTLLALPIGGLILGFTRKIFARRSQSAVDVVEANAIYGGRIPLRDSLLLTFQNLISNGFGASVGLEAAYAQMGGGFASRIGRFIDLKRNPLRTLVGAGAGASIAAAFGAPLAGSFYAFEIVLGGYTSASLAPVAAAALMAVLAADFMQAEPFVIFSSAGAPIPPMGYVLYAGMGAICAIIGIMLVRAVGLTESLVRKLPINELYRPAIGGALLIPLAMITPQIMSSGHGAMHLYFGKDLAFTALVTIFILKALASVISLGFGFRGGLFFASLFLGSLLGAGYANFINDFFPLIALNVDNAALVGMAALAVAVIGGPMTMSLIVLEVTHDFALTAAVFSATLFCNAIVRDRFGYNFATWRMHLRGESIKNARDIGWMRSLNAKKLMRTAMICLDADATVADLRKNVPLSSTSRVLLVEKDGRYAGLVLTAEAYIDQIEPDTPIRHLSRQKDEYVRPDLDIAALQSAFDDFGVDDLAVVDAKHKLLGFITEKYLNRRYAEELEKSQREFFGED